MNVNEVETRLGNALGQISERPAGYALLGRGDGSGAIIADFADRRAYISGTNLAGEAKVAQDIYLSALNNPRLEGLRVKLGYPPYDPKVLYITGYDANEGMTRLGGITLNEQHSSAAQYPDVGKLLNFRGSANAPADLNIFVGPSSYYDLDGKWNTFGGDGLDDDFTDDIAALSSQHQIAVVLFDTTTGELVKALGDTAAGGVDDKDSFSATTIADMATDGDFDDGQILCMAVHLYDGQETITEDDIYRTFDPRVSFPTPGAGSSTASSITVDDGTTTVTDVTAITFNGADFTVTDLTGGAVQVDSTGGSGAGDYILIQDQKTQNTPGGNFPSGSLTRDLNTIVADTTGLVSLSTNQFTLPAGTYRIRASAPAYKVDRHQAQLFNVTDSAIVAQGTSEVSGASVFTTSRSLIEARFTIAGAKAFEVRHSGQTTYSNGLGEPCNFSAEVYTSVELIKE